LVQVDELPQLSWRRWMPRPRPDPPRWPTRCAPRPGRECDRADCGSEVLGHRPPKTVDGTAERPLTVLW